MEKKPLTNDELRQIKRELFKKYRHPINERTPEQRLREQELMERLYGKNLHEIR